MNQTSAHLSLDTLLDYWLGESDDAATAATDEHLIGCETCGQALDELIALGEGVRAALRAGAVAAAASDGFVRRLADHGLRVREYRLARNGSVNCTVAPDDELLVTRLEAPLQGVQRVDMVQRLSIGPDAPRELHDLPFDARTGEVVLVLKLEPMRALPAHTAEFTLLAVGADGSRELGRYTFRHRPWPGH